MKRKTCYECRVLDRNGRPALVFLGGDEMRVRSTLIERGLVPLSVRRRSPLKVGERALIEWLHMVSVLLQMGFPLQQALELLEESAYSPEGRFLSSLTREELRKGESFLSGLEGAVGTLSPFLRGLILVGEKTGRLDEALSGGVEYFTERRKVRDQIKEALLYPAMICGVMIFFLVFSSVYLLPHMKQIFSQLGVTSPSLDALIVSMRGLLLSGVAVVVVSIATHLLRSTTIVRRWRDTLLLKIPLIGTFIKQEEIMKFAFAMKILTQAGYQVDQAWDFGSEVLSNYSLKRHFSRISVLFSKGMGILDILREEVQDLLPPLVRGWLSIGAETGDVAGTWERIYALIRGDVEKGARRLSTLIGPVIILLVGGILILFLISFIVPFFKIYMEIL